MIVIDTSVIYALLDRRDRLHRRAAAWYDEVDDEIATTPMILAEADLLAVARAAGQRLQRHPVRSHDHRRHDRR